ncbi:MAG: (Fe-S)-binding protein [Chloroflexota bacterium]|nr:MAG: (Fe-S)-binding protein [Chloroflexota bacterium]
MPAEGYPIVYSTLLLGLLLGFGFVVFARRLIAVLRLVRVGREDNRLDHFWKRLSLALLFVFGQTRVLENRMPGMAHLVIFYGFLVISLGTLNILWRGFLQQSFIPSIIESSVFLEVMDVTAVLVIVAVLVIAYRRFVIHPLEVRNSFGAIAVLVLISLLMVTLLVTEATALRLGMSTQSSVVAAWTSVALSDLTQSQLTIVYAASYWLHIAGLAAFLAYIPYSKHMHLLVSPFNQFLRSLRPKGSLRAVDVDSPGPIGVGAFSQFTWKHLLDLFACTECGRCLTYCPAYLSGQPLAPRQVILDLKKGLLRRHDGLPSSVSRSVTLTLSQPRDSEVVEAVDPRAIWACTTCRACQDRCPSLIEHVDKIIDIRRFLLETEGASPTLGKALEGLALMGNPQMSPLNERAMGVEKLGVPLANSTLEAEIVYWLGCSGAYEPKAQEISAAVTKILKKAGVPFAVLGSEERCCGDLARRTGEEGLFQELAQHNIANLSRLGAKKVLTSCPHCYNTLRNEYPDFGAEFAVVHHSDFILELLQAKRIELRRPLAQPVTFHDPCYLGRYNGVYDSPRQSLMLAGCTEIREMERARDKALCCGGGGGQTYLEATCRTRVNQLRFAETERLSVAVIATACPFCKLMLDDAARYDSGPTNVRVRDIAELVCEAIPV